MTEKEQQVYDALLECGDNHPTARSLADKMETRFYRAPRFEPNAVRSRLARMRTKGIVSSYPTPKGLRWQPERPV